MWFGQMHLSLTFFISLTIIYETTWNIHFRDPERGAKLPWKVHVKSLVQLDSYVTDSYSGYTATVLLYHTGL